MKCDKFYVVIYPESYMNITGECGQLILTITPKNISDFSRDPNNIVGFYNDYNEAYNDAFDIWEDGMPVMNRIFDD